MKDLVFLLSDLVTGELSRLDEVGVEVVEVEAVEVVVVVVFFVVVLGLLYDPSDLLDESGDFFDEKKRPLNTIGFVV